MKLATQLTLLLVCAVTIAVVAMGGFFAVNLERGFVGYMNAMQERQLDGLTRAAAQLAERFGGLQPLFRDRRLWMRLVRETEAGAVPADLAEWRGTTEPRPPRDGPPDGRGRLEGPASFPVPLDERPPKGRGGRRPPGVEDGGPASNSFVLLDSEGRSVFREPNPAGRRAPIEREILLAGEVVGRIRLHPFESLSRPEDLAFLRRQFLQAAIVGLGVLLLAVLAAPAIARLWTRPLRETGAATERIAKGEFTVRTEPRGADEIAALMANVNAMARSLAAMEVARKRWIAETAHELRTPLMVLRGEVDAMQDGVRAMDARALQSLSEEIRRLTKLVDDLHQLAVADMEGLPCVPARFDAAQSVRAALERFRSRAAERGLELRGDLPRGPLMIEADPDRFEQLLGNLLENSLRYTDSPGRIQVGLVAEGAGVRLTVDDSAPGVAKADCEKLFEPLYRVDAARSRREGGSGLGLSIVRAIVQAHRGRVAARPSRLGGVQVTVELPGR